MNQRPSSLLISSRSSEDISSRSLRAMLEVEFWEIVESSENHDKQRGHSDESRVMTGVGMTDENEDGKKQGGDHTACGSNHMQVIVINAKGGGSRY